MRPTCLLLLAVAAASASVTWPRIEQLEYAVATTENGDVRGLVVTSLNGTPYKRFVGIPYATPPVGDLRFKAPLPAGNWSGTRDALAYGASCTQANRSGSSEDCLYLNVYAPESSGGAPLPVMAYIYGGAFAAGTSSDKAPDYLVENGVLLVTFNYRVGAFGFLSLQNDDIPGNAGLKDQVLALRWVQNNIAAFGGDPSRVTIFGESAGGASTSHLFLSPATKGLFSGAVMQSGMATAPWALQGEPRALAYLLGAALGFQPQGGGGSTAEDDARLAAYLRAADPADLQAQLVPFAPVLEPRSASAVITELPENVLSEGRYNKVPIMLGVNSGEYSSPDTEVTSMNETQAAAVAQLFRESLAAQIQLPTEEERREAAKRVEQFYFGDDGFSVNKTQAINDVYSDMLFIQPAYAFARSVVNTSNLPVFLYYFDYDGFGATEYGMMHAMEIQYLFPGPSGPDKDPTSNDWKVTEQLTTVWTNFGKYGDPTPDGSSMRWDRFSADTDSYLDMELEFESRQHFLQQRMALWRDILHQ